MSIGIGRGPDRSLEAAQDALTSPMIDVPLAGANGILFNIVGNDNLTLHEVNKAAEFIKRVAAPEANIIFGVAHDPEIPPNEVKITLVATGFTSNNQICVADVNPGITVKEPGNERQLSGSPVMPPSLADQQLPEQP